MRLAAPSTASIWLRSGSGGMNWVAPTMAIDPTMRLEWSNTGAANALTPSMTSLAAVAARRVRLFGPRLAYQVNRDNNLRDIQASFTPLLHEVGADRSRFQRFVEFFEAVVAYMRR